MSRMSAEVATLIARHVVPLSVVRASWPRAPSANAIWSVGPGPQAELERAGDVAADRDVVAPAVVGDRGRAAGARRDRARRVRESGREQR